MTIYCYSPGEELGEENHDILWLIETEFLGIVVLAVLELSL